MRRPAAIILLLFRSLLDRVGHTAGDHGRALSTHIGELEIPVVLVVNQALPVARMAVIPIGVESAVLTSFNTFETVEPCLLETEFSFEHGRWF